jgi:dipeptidyl aminopeptidase/acylaminoacyl peptidase
MKSLRSAFFVPLFFLISVSLLSAQQPFTITDAINVQSLSSQNLSDDGRWLAGVITDGHSRFDTDHMRFQDPSYLNVSPGDFVIINTDNGEQVRPYRQKSRVTSMSWSPDSNELAFLEQKGDRLHLMIYSMDRNRTREIRVSGNPILANSSITWTPDGQSLIIDIRDGNWLENAMELYTEATVGPIVVYDGSKPFLKWDEIRNTNRLSKVVEVAIRNGAVKELLPESDYNGVNLTEDGRHMIFNETFPQKTAYVRNSGTEFRTAYVERANPDSVMIIYPKKNQRRNYNWSDSYNRYAWVDSGYVYVQTLGEDDTLNLTKGKAYEDEDEEKEVRFSVMSWSPSETRLLLSSEKGYWIAEADGESLEMIHEFPEDRDTSPNLNLFHWSDDGTYLYFTSSARDKWERGVVRMNIEQREWETLVIDSNMYSGIRVAEDGSKFVLNYSDGDTPSNVVVTDATFSDFRAITDMNTWLADRKMTRSELITYRNVDGKELNGILYYPVDYDPEKTYPLVVEVYEQFFNNGYNRNMNLFTNQGYFGLRPSVDLEMGYPGEAWVKGITSAINKLVDEGKVDNDKVGVQGGSYGGYATSLLITQTDRFAAAINISGKVNIISFLGDSPKIGTRNYAAAEYGQDRIGGSLWSDPLKYFATTAVLYADRINTPHMLMTGEGDWNVPGTNTRELYYAMRRLGKDVIWVNYMNGGHGAGAASNESDFYDHWNRVFEFYAKHFSDKEEEDDEDVED